MGCSLSSSSSSTTTRSNKSSSSSSSSSKNIIRVVHLNGSLEVYDDPITVGQVTGKQPKHFVFAQAQLLSLESKPLGHHAQLQLGNIYFLLPHSVFQSEVSPIDLATISRRLTVVAQAAAAARHGQCSTLAAAKSTKSQLLQTTDRRTSRTTASPNRYADRRTTTTASPNRFSDRRYEGGSEAFYCAGGFNMQNQPNQSSPCWKPILESIIERSFTHRSESDLQELDAAKLGIKAASL